MTTTYCRRRVLLLLASVATLAPLPAMAFYIPLGETVFSEALDAVLGGRAGEAVPGRMELGLPDVAGSGNSVLLEVEVESPMTEADHVTRIHVFTPLNPRKHSASITLTPHMGRAWFSTRIRLATSQEVVVFAEHSDGRLWRASKHVTVSIGACDTLMMR